MCHGLTWVRSILASSDAARRSSEVKGIHLSHFPGKSIQTLLEYLRTGPNEKPLYISRIVRANTKPRRQRERYFVATGKIHDGFSQYSVVAVLLVSQTGPPPDIQARTTAGVLLDLHETCLSCLYGE